MSRCLPALVLLWAAIAPAAGEEGGPAALEGVDLEQRLDGQVPLDLVFRDETGKEVALSSLIGEKPTILNLVYYRCPMLCNLVLDGLVRGLRAVSFDVGKQFQVVTVSFDPRDTPELAAARKEKVLGAYARQGADLGWRFLTGDEGSIRRLTDAVGFRYTYDESSGQYAHASGILVLTPRGRIARYLYGVEYAPRDLRLALVEASANRIGTLADQVLLLCYHYDPATGRYGVLVLGLVRLGGVLTIVCIGAYLLWMWRREARRTSKTARAGSP